MRVSSVEENGVKEVHLYMGNGMHYVVTDLGDGYLEVSGVDWILEVKCIAPTSIHIRPAVDKPHTIGELSG